MVATAIAAVGLLGSGCSIANFNPTAESTDDIPPPELSTRDLPTPEVRRSSLTGSWQGTYTCNQGGMRLNLTLVQSSSGRVTGIFRFSPGPGNSEARSGSFTLRGTVIGRSLTLRGDRWISRPGNYEMVSMSARVSTASPDLLQGDIRDPGCSTFTVRRT
ncbi:hypothetical protein [Spirillospora sp. NPDC048823]|uniref:hypothetical protein n=1 Tax=unclassified Spirillospora TaxID=2642701 RepID=UPI0037189D6A